MTRKDVMIAVRRGNPIDCTAEEYHNRVRRYLHEVAGTFIDYGDGIRAQIALSEIQRLDRKFEPACIVRLFGAEAS